jgi:ketosteroid isomerase-like protein
MSPAEADLLAANAAFYVAFSSGDLDAMESLWARGADVACIHPGWDALRGRPRVMASWQAILSNDGGPKITCSGATAHILGESAFVVCYETIEGTRLVATNTFVREDGSWRLVHHQAAPIARATVDDDDEDDDDLPEPGGVLN